jgi:hypothetical protein
VPVGREAPVCEAIKMENVGPFLFLWKTGVYLVNQRCIIVAADASPCN